MRLLCPRLAVVICLGALVQPAHAQLLVVSAPSVDRVIEDTRYLLKSAGLEQEMEKFDANLKAFNDGKRLKGIDTQKPLGMYVNWPKPGTKMGIVGFIPITREDEFFQFLEAVGLRPVKGTNGVHRLAFPNGWDVHFRLMENYCLASDQEANLPDKLPAIAQLAEPDNLHSIITARVRFQEVTRETREKFLEGFRKGVSESADRSQLDEKTIAMAKRISEEIGARLILDGQDLITSIDVDRQTGKFGLGLALRGTPKSSLAVWIQKLGQHQNRFNNLAQDSLLHMMAALPVPDDLRTMLVQAAEEKFNDSLRAIQNPGERQLLSKLMDTIKASLQADMFEGGMFMHGPYGDGKYSMTLAVGLAKGSQVESVLQEMAKQSPPPSAEGFKLNVAKLGNVPVHFVKPSKGFEGGLRVYLGGDDLYVAFHDKAMLIAYGRHGLEAMKEAVARMDKPLLKRSTATEVEVSMRRGYIVVEKDNPDMAEAVKRVFVGADRDKDKLRFTWQGGDALRLRCEMDMPVFRLFGLMAEKRRQQ